MNAREASKTNWTFNNPTTPEAINAGSLQRIADATEAMATNYQQLITERDRYQRWYNAEEKENKRLYRVIAGLRGTITKLKKKNENS